MDQPPHSRLFGISLGFLAGYVDTLGFIALFGLFTAHVTGNFVLIGAALADASRMSILLKFLAFPAFIAGVAITRLMVLAVERRAGPSLTLAMLLQWALLAGFMVLGILAEPIGKDVSSMAMAAGLLGTAAMGVHAPQPLLLAHLAHLHDDGNVTQIVIDPVDVLRGACRCRHPCALRQVLLAAGSLRPGPHRGRLCLPGCRLRGAGRALAAARRLIIVQHRSGRAAVPAA